jgi:hypothetical protein
MRMSLGDPQTLAPTGGQPGFTSVACGGLPIFHGPCSPGTVFKAATCGAVMGPDGVTLGVCEDSGNVPGGPSSVTCKSIITPQAGGIGGCVGPLDAGTWALIGGGLLLLFLVSK